jgi:hypothetical protein
MNHPGGVAAGADLGTHVPEKLGFGETAGLAAAFINGKIPAISALSEIEQAADSLSAAELRALLGHVEARLKLAGAGARTKETAHFMQTLRELARPMGGKSRKSRDRLHER